MVENKKKAYPVILVQAALYRVFCIYLFSVSVQIFGIRIEFSLWRGLHFQICVFCIYSDFTAKGDNLHQVLETKLGKRVPRVPKAPSAVNQHGGGGLGVRLSPYPWMLCFEPKLTFKQPIIKLSHVLEAHMTFIYKWHVLVVSGKQYFFMRHLIWFHSHACANGKVYPSSLKNSRQIGSECKDQVTSRMQIIDYSHSIHRITLNNEQFLQGSSF